MQPDPNDRTVGKANAQFLADMHRYTVPQLRDRWKRGEYAGANPSFVAEWMKESGR